MLRRDSTRRLAVAGVVLLAASGCGYLSGEGGAGGGGDASGIDCSPYEQWEDIGGSVSLYSSIRDEEAERMDRSWADFEACTGIDIKHEGSGEFEAQLPIRLEGGNAPDLALIPQPGLLERVVSDGHAVPVSDGVKANVEEGWGEDWRSYATIDGELYGSPYGANMKSMVWYSPTYFSENGHEVPETWDDMVALSDEIAESGTKPWCVGFESGDGTGWPGTDWIENALLRTGGTETYNQWVSHEIPFDDPKVAEAFDLADGIVRNPDYVNGTFGDMESIAITSFQEAGLPLLDGGCAMYLMGSFYSAQFGEDVEVGEDGDVYGFVLPPLEAGAEVPVMGGGEFAVPFADRPEVAAVHEYLSTPEYANSRASEGAWVSANQNMDTSVIEDPASQFAAEVLLAEDTVFHFDASDSMPASVGTDAFWTGMIDWVTGSSTDEVLEAIESAWP
ncbi:ABC transporter substrate-binding protein [Nocardiopsis algeriensis]|uniref:Alpha-glucoside transport system substrate-binding protein n=1 Tax=Nocardiopsis algeriensis TaxID=1478215 RepID=A0A841IPS7_9ACTN|nr:ABC transporter substrate-binding protein [Nocardiopsis algeriensis]MBB6120727.1 alpha-glucoside transport system substrate-binding protein [Nocardiopsis algeriensis]